MRNNGVSQQQMTVLTTNTPQRALAASQPQNREQDACSQDILIQSKTATIPASLSSTSPILLKSSPKDVNQSIRKLPLSKSIKIFRQCPSIHIQKYFFIIQSVLTTPNGGHSTRNNKFSLKQFQFFRSRSPYLSSYPTYYTKTTMIMQTDTAFHKQVDHGIDIAFKNINYSVKVEIKSDGLNLPFNRKYKDKVILDNVSGICKSGHLTSIMGSSGAGKTSLLNIIACRIDLQKGGHLWANNKPYSYQDFGNFANYVMQTDVLMSTLTVRETLTFAANLKLDCSLQQKNQKIMKLSKQLKLQNCLDVIVGGQLIKGISGGERKRTSIAFQLISDPQVIILDEPTSGLDSLTSFIIVQYLSNMARQKNKTVIMTIHQPNSEIYALFDHLILMVQGRLIYHGAAKEATNYFDLRFGLKCPQFYNPPDYFMSIMHQQNPKNIERFAAYFSQFDQHILPIVQQQIEKRNMDEIVNRKVQLSLYTTYSELVGRDFKNVLRNPLMAKSRFFQTTALYIYVGGLFYNLTNNGNYTDDTTILKIAGFFFFLSLNSLMIAMVPITLVFPLQRQIFLKEQGSKLYSTTAYFLSRNIIQIPYAFIFPMIQALIVYWFIGLSNTASQFFIFYFILYLIAFNGMSIGLFLGSLVQDARTITTLAPAMAQIISLLSGYFKNLSNLPKWIGWVQYLSPLRYSYQGFVENEVQFAPSNIARLNFNLSIWSCIGLLIAIGIAFRVSSLFFLYTLRSRLQ